MCSSSVGVLLEVISEKKWYHSVFYLRLLKMFKRRRTSTMSDDVHAPTPTLHPPIGETGMPTCLWVMRMEVSLEAHDL